MLKKNLSKILMFAFCRIFPVLSNGTLQKTLLAKISLKNGKIAFCKFRKKASFCPKVVHPETVISGFFDICGSCKEFKPKRPHRKR